MSPLQVGSTSNPRSILGALASAPGSANAGDMYFNTTSAVLYVYDGSTWVGLNEASTSQPADTGNGNGAAYTASNVANAVGITSNSMTQHIDSWYKSAGGNGTPLIFTANESSTSNFAFHTGHNGNSSQWPLYFAIQIDPTTPRVINEIEWVKHMNAVGNVDVFGSNVAISSSNYRDESNYTFLGRVHMGGQGSEADGTHKKGYFNHWAWGFKWYMLKLVDVQGDEYHGIRGYPDVGTLDGWAMYGLRLNKVADWVGAGFMATDAFSDGNCKAHYKFESDFTDSTGIANGVAFNGGTAGNAGGIDVNCFLGDADSGFYSPTGVSPTISDYPAGNNAWAVSLWFKIASGTTTTCSLFHASRTNDYDRPGCWLRRIDGSNYRIEYFSSSNGTSWDVCKGDVGSSTDARGNQNKISLDEWHHFAWSRNSSGDYDAFVDGLLDFHHTDSTSLYSSGNYAWNWGNWFHSANNYGFIGNLDNIRVFNRNLTTDEVKQLYLRHS